MSNEPALVNAIVGVLVTAVIGVLVGKGVIGDPSADQKAAIIGGVASAVMLVVGYLTRRKVTPVAKDA